ncbi:MAG: hypothetical protein P8107_11050 [Spirochaetia bacterium]
MPADTDNRDRLDYLSKQDKVTGLDFLEIKKGGAGRENNIILKLYFHKTQAQPAAILRGLKKEDIRILSLSNTETPEPIIEKIEWQEERNDAAGKYLRITLPLVPGAYRFDQYELSVNHDKIDHYYRKLKFTFQAGCPSKVDCKPEALFCPPSAERDFIIDYMSRDFSSFRRALLEYASRRYPLWQDRLEADLGMLLVDVMSALGDEMAYYQDRIAREAYLETAVQRRSVRRHARLVDYSMHDGLTAFTMLCVIVKKDCSLIAGVDKVWAGDYAGGHIFEVGSCLQEMVDEKSYELSVDKNELTPHIWEEDDICLVPGTTEIYVESGKAELFEKDSWILLEAREAESACKLNRCLVQLREDAAQLRDELFDMDILHLKWKAEQALTDYLPLKGLKVFANIVPTIAGTTCVHDFYIHEPPPGIPWSDLEKMKKAVERQGPDGEITYLFSLPGTEEHGLARRSQDREIPDPCRAQPEIELKELVMKDGALTASDLIWESRTSLLGNDASRRDSSGANDKHYTLDDCMYTTVVSFHRAGEIKEHVDYASGNGATIRFGDGTFGLQPAGRTVFRVKYRIGVGKKTNITHDSLIHFVRRDDEFAEGESRPDRERELPELIQSVRNPLPAINGVDPESMEHVRQQAPYAYQCTSYRAVTEADYAEAAERLEWVAQAGCVFRWTGSWLSAFVTPDPLHTVSLTPAQRRNLLYQLDRFRQAGSETHIHDPRYVNLDLEITVCVEPHAYRGDVRKKVSEALVGRDPYSAGGGYFTADNFSFGTPLMVAELEAVIKNVPGVRAVTVIKIGRRGWFKPRVHNELTFTVAENEVIRVENDPRHQNRGSLKLEMRGGV